MVGGASLHNRGRERVLEAGQARPDLRGGGGSAGGGSTLVPKGGLAGQIWPGPGRAGRPGKTGKNLAGLVRRGQNKG